MKKFKSDGCSGGMSIFWRILFKKAPPWEGCCYEHDTYYHTGGTAKQRKKADLRLMSCVTLRGYPIWAFIIYVGVRLGGVPWLPLPWRWGFGRLYKRSWRYERRNK